MLRNSKRPTAIEIPAPTNKVAWRRLIAPAKRSLGDNACFLSAEPSIQSQYVAGCPVLIAQMDLNRRPQAFADEQRTSDLLLAAT
jgi:hypothetical protein